MSDPKPPEGERRLAAIMFTDMVGFTALTQRNEALALELLEEQRSLVRRHLASFRGREVETSGDSFLLEFPSALDAVRCALEIQSELKAANSKVSTDKHILLRIGIHLGDVLHTGTKVAGDAVNIASRIEPLAPAGGVCITAQVHASVLHKIECQFESLGTPELKNVSIPIEVFRISGYGQSPSGPAPVKPALPKDRVAVLPFTNISADKADEYFADGMTEEIISSVSRTKGLRVIARTSVMRYKESRKPIAEVAREIGRAHV